MMFIGPRQRRIEREVKPTQKQIYSIYSLQLYKKKLNFKISQRILELRARHAANVELNRKEAMKTLAMLQQNIKDNRRREV